MKCTRMQSLAAFLLVGSLCLISCKDAKLIPEPRIRGTSNTKSTPESGIYGTGNTTVAYYKPPFSSERESRRRGTANLGGGGNEIAKAVLDPIAPRKKSLISNSQPKLYFCVSQASSAPLEVAVNSVSRRFSYSLFDKKLPPPTKSKIYEVPVGNIEFKAGEDYKWRVAWVFSDSDRSKDIIAGADFCYQPLDDKIDNQLKNSPATEKWRIYAANGYWYDAIAALYNQAQTGRCDDKLREQWVGLLKQEDLELPTDCDPCIKR